MRRTSQFLETDPIKENFHFEEVEKDVFKNSTLKTPGGHVKAYGGLLCAQSLAAADKTVSTELNCHSFQSNFILPVNLDLPVFYHVKRLFDGRSFATRYVECRQEKKIMLSALIAYHKPEVHAIEHQSEMPVVQNPEDCQEFDTVFAYHQARLPLGSRTHYDQTNSNETKLVFSPYDYRCTDPQRFYTTKSGTDKHCYWTRYKFPIEDTRRMHYLTLLYISDNHNVMIVYNGHLRDGFIPSMTFSLNHTIYFHGRPFNANDWMLIELESPSAASGRGLTRGRIWNESGEMIASISQEAVVRKKEEKGAKL